MILFIDTITQQKTIYLALSDGQKIIKVKRIATTLFNQSEKLLPGIKKLLFDDKINLSKLTAIAVVNRGQPESSFTGLRLGVAAANALAFGLNIPIIGIANFNQSIRLQSTTFSMSVLPIYNRQTNPAFRNPPYRLP